MKKGLFCIFCLLVCLLLLCACTLVPGETETEESIRIPTYRSADSTELSETEPSVFDEVPASCDTGIVIDGVRLPQCFREDGVLYVCLEDLTEALPFSYRGETGAGEKHTCTLTGCGHVLSIHTCSAYGTENHTVYALGAEPLFDGEHWYLPVQKLLATYGFHVLEDTEENTLYFTQYPINDTVVSGKEIPILMYHAVSDNCWGTAELFVSPSDLDAQIAALLENGYTLITFEDFDRLDEIEKPVMLTFDDGYDDNYTDLFPILQKYQVKATVFVITDDIGKNHKLTAEQITEMSDSGLVSIQSHTLSHNYLSYMGEEQLEEELFQSKLLLTRLTGKEPFVLCYPTGMYSTLSLEITAKYYQFGLKMNGDLYTTGEDPYLITRYYVYRGMSAQQLLQKIS